jgi:hypothetical protein
MAESERLSLTPGRVQVTRSSPFRLSPVTLRPILATGTLILGSVVAHADELRMHGAHQHGASQMNVALEPGVITIELSGPMANFAGFERPPRNDDERGTINSALNALRNPTQLFAFEPQTVCEPSGTQLTLPSFVGVGNWTDSVRVHDDDHHHDFTARYEFSCAADRPLTVIHARLFDDFPWTDTLQVQLVGPDLQLREILTPQSHTLRIRQR